MGTKMITYCDGCNHELTTPKAYQIVKLKTDTFYDAAGQRDYNVIDLHFCANCGRNLLACLEKLCAQKEGEKDV